MSLSHEQLTAETRIKGWLSGSDQIFMLGGYAGTGKTYLMGHIINSVGYHAGHEILCCAPTGKAASVLMSKLNGKDVSTVHSLIYAPMGEDTGKLEALLDKLVKDPENETLTKEIEVEKRRISSKPVSFQISGKDKVLPGQLVIIDEASMVSDEMFHDLVATGAKLMFVGDPGQLPPVGSGGWFIKAKYDVVLEEVQRQALESPIIRLSMDVRNSNLKKSQYSYPDCKICDKSEVPISDWLDSDQVITGTNASRRRINRFFRKQLKHNEKGDLPQISEKIICLKNSKPVKGISNRYINGVQGSVIKSAHYDEKGDLRMSIFYESNILEDIAVYDYHFLQHYETARAIDPFFMRRDLKEFDYAYAITVHKSQGSEWNSVIIADDKMQQFKKDFRKRWLYTAITRAKEKLIWSE